MRCVRSNNRSGGDGDYNAIGTEQDEVYINREPALLTYKVVAIDVTEPAYVCIIHFITPRSSLYFSVIHILYMPCSDAYLLHHMGPVQLIGSGKFAGNST